jgi:DNA-binding beta-propeller fold protein YncE
MGSKDGQFLKLHDMAVDPTGEYVYTLELKNHRVQKFTSDGKFILKWTFENTGGKGSERTPHQLSVDSKGFVYLTDKNGHQILKFDENGNFIKTLGKQGSGEGEFVRPHGIVFDSKDNMFITDMRNSCGRARPRCVGGHAGRTSGGARG